MTAGLGLLAGLATPAAALPFNLQPSAPPPPAAAPQPDVMRPSLQRPARPAATASRDKSAGKEQQSPQDLASKAKGLLSVVISIDKQQLTLYSDGHPIAHSRVSTGTAGHPTPTGVFSVIPEERWHRSNLSHDAPTYSMQPLNRARRAAH